MRPREKIFRDALNEINKRAKNSPGLDELGLGDISAKAIEDADAVKDGPSGSGRVGSHKDMTYRNGITWDGPREEDREYLRQMKKRINMVAAQYNATHSRNVAIARCSPTSGYAIEKQAISPALMAGKLTPTDSATTRSTKYGARSA